MANTSEEIIRNHSTSVEPFGFNVCLPEAHYGLIFGYIVMSVCILVGTPAHFWCLWLYLSDGKPKQTQVFLLNHTIMEILSCIECAIEILNNFVFMNYNVSKCYIFMFGLSWTGRPLIQMCICIEQYFAVLHPVTFLKYKGIQYRIAAVAVAWLIAFGYGLYQVYYMTLTDLAFNALFIVTVAVISYCCVSVLCALKHPGPGDNTTGVDVRNKQKKNAFNMIFTVLLIFLMTFVPQACLSIFSVVKIYWVVFYCNLAPIVSSFSMFTLIITPLLKMHKEGYLKKYLKKGN